MKRVSNIEFLKLNKAQKLWYKIKHSIINIPTIIALFLKKVLIIIKKFFSNLFDNFADIFYTFKKGDYKTRISFFIMGFGNIARGQLLRGFMFFLFQIIFIFYMVSTGSYYISKVDNLGDFETSVITQIDPNTGREVQVTVVGENSFKILLYGVISILFVIAFIYTWRINIRQNKIAQEIIDSGKKIKSGKQDIQSLVDDQFHKTLLALPITGIIIFTILPLLFMVLIAFTNYDGQHTPPSKLFTWVGLDNFNQLITWSSNGANFSATFGEILVWTLIWACFATFSNYFLGMVVAIMINKKGIKFKKLWRTILVITIAVPQFISLLYVSKMFSTSGIVNGFLKDIGLISQPIDFWGNKTLARIMVIVINLWVGIPYIMLIATGILMNIPQDLYESAKIDGANTFQQYVKITLPYMLFVTGPYLLTSFISNMNNFNVIYLLTGGAPDSIFLTGGAGYTDLLVTWLYKLTIDRSQYNLAAVIGIMVFLVVSIISLIVYNIMPSIKNEEDYQ